MSEEIGNSFYVYEHRSQRVRLARDGKSVSTVKSALAAVQHYHREAGHPLDRSNRAIASVMAGIVRTASRPIRRAAALELAGLRAIIGRINGEDVPALRDRALLLVAFFGALRRSELVALDVAGNNVKGRSSVEVRREGLLVHLTGTKASAATQTVAIPSRQDELCAAAAVERYVAVAGIANGPLFRAVSKSGRLLERRLEASSVRHILKVRAGAGSVFSPHSLRSGFITSAADANVPEHLIQRTSRHRSVETLRGYIRAGDPFECAARHL